MTELTGLLGADFRRSIRDFLTANLPTDWEGIGALTETEREQFSVRWRDLLHETKVIGFAFPTEYGGLGLGPLEQSILREEFVRAGVPVSPHPNDIHNLELLGPTMVHWGTSEQKEFFIPRLLSGEHKWAQGYSEPEAGSDLFGLRTRARAENDQWIVNGQKIWTTAGTSANWIFVLCRTDPVAPKAKGLSFLLVPMDQPGVTARAIRTMTGEEEYAEVFFDDATTESDRILGRPGQGATVALTLLGFERSLSAASEAMLHELELERMWALADEHDRLTDPVIRQRLGWCYSRVMQIRDLGLEALDGLVRGESPGSESSLLKLITAEYHKVAMEVVVDILGVDGLVETGRKAVAPFGPNPRGVPNDPRTWLGSYYMSRAATIYGGSSQIQRNTIAERLLRLPREPAPPQPPAGTAPNGAHE